MKNERLALTPEFITRAGRPWLPMMGEFHYSRYPAGFWDQELAKVKAGGIDIVATYAFWIHHEEEKGRFNWSGDRDLGRFVRLCARHGLKVWLRIGPFAHGEVRNGGLPDWLYEQPFSARSNDPRYLALARRLYREIGRQVRGLMHQDGGPIIGVQVENEFMASAAPWETTQNTGMDFTPKGTGGIGHLRALKRLARAAGLIVPVYSCTGWGGAPKDDRDFLAVYGGYAFYAWLDNPAEQKPTENYLFSRPRYENRRTPLAHCEIGGGMQVFYRNRPVVPPVSVEAMALVKLGSGANMLGFYMYHGGSNPIGRTYLNEHRTPRISYDFQAPIGEYGQRREHYWRLRRLGLFLQAFGDRLAPLRTVLSPGTEILVQTDTRTPRWAVREKDGAGFVFLNNYQDHLSMRVHRRLVLHAGTVTFPPVTLKREVAAILPFNFDLDGILLWCATAQPLTRTVERGVAHYYFFAPRGMRATYVFEHRTITVRPGTKSTLRLTAPKGRRVLLTTLTDGQSLYFGHPPVPPERTSRLPARTAGAGKWEVRVPSRLLRHNGEVLLRISYDGDTGAAYLDGRLIADNFCNGMPWEIGLRRFASRLAQSPLMLVITPPSSTTIKYSAMATMEQTAAGKAHLSSLQVVMT